MKYPGSASENLNYYDQFNPEFKEKYEQLETIVGKVIGGKLIFKLGRHKYEYNLQSVKDLSLTSWLKEFLASNWFTSAKVSRFTFYNPKLYQWKVVDVIYHLENGKLKIYWAAEQWILEKFEKPKVVNLDFRYQVGMNIAKLLKLKDFKIKVDGNQITIFQEKIHSHHKTYKKWIFKFELDWGRKVEIKPILQIYLWGNGGLIKTPHGKILGRIECYGNDCVILNVKGQIVSSFSHKTRIKLDLPALNTKLIIDFKK